ncbi:hypothetical protein GKQ77_01540 [Streptomyces sp. BG9H]|uniref:Uncharacterized protein n=1 Tax=Streptomyces anatolicus TaxID=2675858 RepID=A0ABS6YFR2_9ACTN|nr:hypothetical protein [Streptomyces anatolicus]MBW5420253.1 hypothetical protein [Streptomyces anatolicus]
MTPRAEAPEPDQVEIRQMIASHTYGCHRCHMLGRVCPKGRILRRTLEAHREPPAAPGETGGPK